MRLQHDDLHTLTGSYAVDALPPDELDEFERHLTHCGSCASEVRGLRETAARLALAVAEQPPAQMRAQVLAAAERTRQLPPITSDRPSRGAPRSIRSARSARAARRVWIPRISVVAAAASVALAVVFGVSQSNTSSRLSTLENQLSAARVHNQQVDSVLAQGDLRLVSNKTSVGGSVSAIVSPSAGPAGRGDLGPARAARGQGLRALAARPVRGPAVWPAHRGRARAHRPGRGHRLRQGVQARRHGRARRRHPETDHHPIVAMPLST